MAEKNTPKTVAQTVPYDPWAEKVTIKLPKDKTTKEDALATVNGRSFLIQRGVSVDVPRPVYEMLMDNERSEEEADAFIEANASE